MPPNTQAGLILRLAAAAVTLTDRIQDPPKPITFPICLTRY
jgi:hypothetical protein